MITQYLINENERDFLIQAFGEVPAKISYKPIKVLEFLPKYFHEEEKKSQTEELSLD
jgi:hypothetical protein